jgi:ribonuclease P/MRP protein subunit POP1
MGLPFFPSDFPDCNAYTNFMATEAAALNQKTERCPPDVRPWRVPIPPPWDTARLAFNKGPTRVGNRKIHSEEDMVDGNLLSNSDSENCSISSFVHHGNQFDGVVARTYSVLTDFMREIQGDHLLLFPQLPDRKTSFCKFMKDESMVDLSLNDIAQFSHDRKLCYLRILLHAYKEGVFEEGAVVCAPQLTDIELLITR